MLCVVTTSPNKLHYKIIYIYNIYKNIHTNYILIIYIYIHTTTKRSLDEKLPSNGVMCIYLLFKAVGWLVGPGSHSESWGPKQAATSKLSEQGPPHETWSKLTAARPSQRHYNMQLFLLLPEAQKVSHRGK